VGRPAFTAPLRDGASGTCELVNARTGQTVARDVEAALSRATRRRGLLGRDGMPEHAALVIAPCPAVHTIAMRFSLDIVFVDRDGTAVRVVKDLRPWRMAASPTAYAVIEMPAGALGRNDVAPGDRLLLRAIPARL